MDLYAYISLQSFVEGCRKDSPLPTLVLQSENLLHTVPQEDYQYGLSLLRKAIRLYEEQKGILPENSKQAIPFFRENRRMLIGPEMELYKISFYEEGTPLPDWLQAINTPFLKLTFDYEALAEHCLLENLFLIRCKYDEEQTIQTFLHQLEREYDKFFFDEEHSGFTSDSRFFSMLCNACLEVKEVSFAQDREWRLAILRSPAEAEYQYKDSQLKPVSSVSLPLTLLRRVALLKREDNRLNYSSLAGFMQSIGLSPERCLEGMLEE